MGKKTATLSLALMLTVMGFGCAGAQTGTGLKRELPKLPIQAISSADGYFTGSVEAKAAPKISLNENTYVIEIPLEADGNVACLLLKERSDLSTAIVNLQANVSSKARRTEVISVDAGHTGGIPFLHLEQLLEMDSAGSAVSAHVKYRAANLPGNTLLCVHDSPGLSRTFSRIVSGLANSLKIKTAATAGVPSYRTVLVVSAEKRRIGIVEMLLYPAKDGGKVMTTLMSMLLPRGSDVVSVEEAQAEVSNSAGLVLRQVSSALEGGKQKYEIELARIGTGKYSVKGKFMGKPVQTTITHHADLVSGPNVSLQLSSLVFGRKPASGAKTAVTVTTYSPNNSPLKLMDMTFRTVSSNPKDPVVEGVMGTMAMRTGIDAQGWPRHVTIPAGGKTIKMTRVFSQGKP